MHNGFISIFFERGGEGVDVVTTRDVMRKGSEENG